MSPSKDVSHTNRHTLISVLPVSVTQTLTNFQVFQKSLFPRDAVGVRGHITLKTTQSQDA